MAGIDPIWEEKYARGYNQRYPWDAVVSFVFRNAPNDRPRDAVSILEVGCGTASNLWFAAREGFTVAGIDGSASAIETARRFFAAEGLAGDLRVGDFTAPFDVPDNAFDLVIDRGALCCCGVSQAAGALREIHRVMKPGGRVLFNPYSTMDTSAQAGRPEHDGLRVDIDRGALQGVGQLAFYDHSSIDAVMGEGWKEISRTHVRRETSYPNDDRAEDEVLAYWIVILEKPAHPQS
jgi:SAM-dependent methyltransferase